MLHSIFYYGIMHPIIPASTDDNAMIGLCPGDHILIRVSFFPLEKKISTERVCLCVGMENLSIEKRKCERCFLLILDFLNRIIPFVVQHFHKNSCSLFERPVPCKFESGLPLKCHVRYVQIQFCCC